VPRNPIGFTGPWIGAILCRQNWTKLCDREVDLAIMSVLLNEVDNNVIQRDQGRTQKACFPIAQIRVPTDTASILYWDNLNI
jgi:hypothetical protein